MIGIAIAIALAGTIVTASTTADRTRELQTTALLRAIGGTGSVRAESTCVGFENVSPRLADPPEAVMRRIVDRYAGVRPVSECADSDDVQALTVGPAGWDAANRVARVEVSLYRGRPATYPPEWSCTVVGIVATETQFVIRGPDTWPDRTCRKLVRIAPTR